LLRILGSECACHRVGLASRGAVFFGAILWQHGKNYDGAHDKKTIFFFQHPLNANFYRARSAL
jgi:hypothetical protein